MKTTIFILATLLILTTTTFANDSNVLLTGETLPKDGQLSYKDTAFIMQNDCNLVLYNHAAGFSSRSNQAGSPNCTLSLNNQGQLVVTDSFDDVLYTSPSNSTKKGNFAAVLRPDGQVAVYGPILFSSTPPHNSINDDMNERKYQGNIPTVQNLLFSSQILYNGQALETRDYKLLMDGDCDFKLLKAGNQLLFASKTAGKGRNCFTRLDHKGVLTVLDDKYKSLWTSGRGGSYGDYVLIMQINGQAVVYGPAVWDTSNP